ncbi:MAG: hypothetical protein COB85_04510 [Bacteroidetes bacterium]|nr:MAG: hypothetical protein COB85_04510 [Bacteroidota bacterium]
MYRILLLVITTTVLISCGDEVKEQEKEETIAEETSVTPLVVQVAEEPVSQNTSGDGNSINESGLIKWYLNPDANLEDYRIQQHKWNKWVDMGGVDPTALKGDYCEFQVKLFAGNNIFRLRKKGRAKKRVPPVEIFVKLQDLKSSVSWSFNADETIIEITEEAMYEIFNEAGNLVDKGTSAEIDISGLAVGGYYFNYALFMDSFQKK